MGFTYVFYFFKYWNQMNNVVYFEGTACEIHSVPILFVYLFILQFFSSTADKVSDGCWNWSHGNMEKVIIGSGQGWS